VGGRGGGRHKGGLKKGVAINRKKADGRAEKQASQGKPSRGRKEDVAKVK